MVLFVYAHACEMVWRSGENLAESIRTVLKKKFLLLVTTVIFEKKITPGFLVVCSGF